MIKKVTNDIFVFRCDISLHKQYMQYPQEVGLILTIYQKPMNFRASYTFLHFQALNLTSLGWMMGMLNNI